MGKKSGGGQSRAHIAGMDVQPHVMAQNGYHCSSHYTHVLGNKERKVGKGKRGAPSS